MLSRKWLVVHAVYRVYLPTRSTPYDPSELLTPGPLQLGALVYKIVYGCCSAPETRPATAIMSRFLIPSPPYSPARKLLLNMELLEALFDLSDLQTIMAFARSCRYMATKAQWYLQ